MGSGSPVEMSSADRFITSLCLYREARGEGLTGMTAVACVIRNRTAKHHTSFYAEVLKPLQFSSMTAPGDRQLGYFAGENDRTWQVAQETADRVISGQTADITGGATHYHDNSIGFPKGWGDPKAYTFLRQIGKLYFYRENA